MEKISLFKKFLNRTYLSEASILIFYIKDCSENIYKNGENFDRKYDYIVIRKNEYQDDGYTWNKPDFSRIIELSFVGKEINFKIKINLDSLNEDHQNVIPKSPNHNIENKEHSFNEEDFESNLNKIEEIDIENIDLENYYKILNKSDFKRKLKIIYSKVSYKSWTKHYFLGLISDVKYFCQKFSDYGSENTFATVFANSAYFHFNKTKVFVRTTDPSGHYDKPDFDKYAEDIFKYFYDGYEFLLINFDEMGFSQKSKLFYHNRRMCMEDKKFMLPPEFSENTYILSDQIEWKPINIEEEEDIQF